MILDDVLTAENSNTEALTDKEREAWQRLVDSGIVWQLQGFFGRTASRLIGQGVLKDHVGNDTR